MGSDQRSVTVYGRVSRHNSPQDAEDDALFDDLVERIRRVVEDQKYAGLEPSVD